MKLTKPVSKEPSVTKSVTDEKKIEALIEKGGSSVSTEQSSDGDDEKQQLRLVAYTSQLREIKEAIDRMPKRGRPSRHTWILQAIDEKLEREKQQRS